MQTGARLPELNHPFAAKHNEALTHSMKSDLYVLYQPASHVHRSSCARHVPSSTVPTGHSRQHEPAVGRGRVMGCACLSVVCALCVRECVCIVGVQERGSEGAVSTTPLPHQKG